MYKQYCQSIFKYGLELLHIPAADLLRFNIRQNILIKRAIGIKKYTKSSPLLTCLKIESIKELYHKHKLFMAKQLKSNEFTNKLFNNLIKVYSNKLFRCNNDSIIKQISIVNKILKIENCLINITNSIIRLSSEFRFNEKGILDSINFLLSIFNKDTNFSDKIKILEGLLDYKNYRNDNILSIQLTDL